MTAVYCFSATGRTRVVAEALAGLLGVAVQDMETAEIVPVDVAAVVFPVYCQNVPAPAADFLRRLAARYVLPVATYGKMHYGNVLQDAARLTRAQVIGGACIPIGHTYRGEPAEADADRMAPLADRMRHPQAVELPRAWKNPLADLMPTLRGVVGVRLTRTDACTQCGLCEARCPMGAIRDGIITGRCIRCLRCASECPQGALETRLHPALKWYLSGKQKEEWYIYL